LPVDDPDGQKQYVLGEKQEVSACYINDLTVCAAKDDVFCCPRVMFLAIYKNFSVLQLFF
jgi:hypothetical protein